MKRRARFSLSELPIVQAPMAGAHGVDLAVAASRCGMLGSLALGWSEPAAIVRDVAAMHAATDRPFAANLFVERPVEPDAAAIAAANDALRRYRDELGISQPPAVAKHVPFAEQFDALLAARPHAFSFTFGIPPEAMLDACRARGIATIGTAKTVSEARALEAAGVDAICVQGYEAGGHHGPFLEPSDDAQIGTFALVPQVADAVRVPAIAAGGITDGRGVAAAFVLGASAVQIGSAFLFASEATTSGAQRAAIRAGAQRTTLTRAFSGRTARGVRNRFIDEMEAGPLAAYPFQHWLTRDIRSAAAERGETALLSLWAGQAAGLARDGSVAEILAHLLADARESVTEALAPLGIR